MKQGRTPIVILFACLFITLLVLGTVIPIFPFDVTYQECCFCDFVTSARREGGPGSTGRRS